MSRDKKVTQFGNIQNANPIDAVFSPKGRWVAYNSGQTGKNEVFVQPFPATRAQYQIPKGADNHAPIWSPDETELFYVAGPGQFAAVRITVQPSFDIGNAVAVFNGSSRGTNPPSISRNFDIMPDGKHILAVVAASQDQTGATFGPQIQVILNWFDDLKRRIEVNH
jgi:serine/threonine-protein kinase